MVNEEIDISGYRNKLHLGIVLTGGGAQLKYLSQLVEYITGKEVKLGLPDPHLGKGLVDEIRSPMYATCAGLVINGFKNEAIPNNTGGQNSTKRVERTSRHKNEGLLGFLGSFKKWLDDDQSLDDFK
jgi:cell division protein FtsA